MRRFFYHFKCALQNIRINRSSAFFSVMTTALTLMLFGIFLLFYQNISGFLASIQRDVEISIYLRDAISQDETRFIEKTLKADKRLFSFRYISREEALLLFQETFSAESLVKHLGENPLPSSFEVNVKPIYQNPEEMAKIAEALRKLPGVEEVQYGVEWLKNFSDFLTIVKFLGIGLGVGLAVAVVTIIAHTIRLHFYDRSEEVEIMKLIGATHRFIKNPFLLEGILLGAIGGALACSAIFGLFRFVDLHLSEVGGVLGKLLRLHFLPPCAIAGMIMTGALLGGLGGEFSLTYLLRFRAKTIPKHRFRPGRGGLFCLLAATSLMAFGPVSLWGKDDAAVIKAKKKELKRVEREIQKNEAKKMTLQKEETSILSTLEAMDHRIRAGQKEAQSLATKIKKKEGELKYASGTLQDLEASIEKRRALVARRVRLLYQQGSEGVLTVLIPSPRYPAFLKRLHYLKTIAEKEADLLSVLEEEQSQWEAKNSQIGSIREQLVAAQAPLVARLDKIEAERKKKHAFLTRIRTEKAHYEKALPELDKASTQLKGLIQKLEEERRRREAAAKIPPPPPTGGFVKVKGRLLWPNDGPVTSLFGRQKHPRFDTYVFKKGIEIETSREETVRAVHAGTVVYADWFKGYGMIIILDHGDDYYSVYGYLAQLFVAVGDKPAQNYAIGTVGDTGPSDGTHLYFELRHQGEPMDPLAWLQKRG